MKRKPILFTVAILACAFLWRPLNAYGGNPTAYKITIKEVKLKKSTDGEWITIASPNQEINVAAVGQNSAAGSFNVNIPAGSYDNFMLVCSDRIKFSGSDTVGLNTYYTKAGGIIDCHGTVASDGSTYTWAHDPPTTVEGTDDATPTETGTQAEQGEVTEICDLANNGDGQMSLYMITDSATPVVVNANSKVSMYFDFDTQGTLHVETHSFDQMYLLPPQAGSEFGITVDGITYSITAAEMRFDF